MQRSSRVDYDAIAELYDSTPHREKSADPELIAFLGGRGPSASLTLLDIPCGTGNQQIANRGLAPDARLVALDGSLGMLRQARRKMADIAWVHGDSAALPFTSGSFDFISCQYAFHHFRDGHAGRGLSRAAARRPVRALLACSLEWRACHRLGYVASKRGRASGSLARV